MKNTYLHLKTVVFSIGTYLLAGSSIGQTCGYTCGSGCPTVPGTAGSHTVVYCTPGTCTFTVPTPVTNITVEVFGAGGGGGGARSRSNVTDDACAAGGGGGGGGFTSYNFNVTGGQSYTVTVGAGGTGGSVPSGLGNTHGANSNAGTPGVTGGSSSFTGNSINLVATGGVGGNSASTRTSSSGFGQWTNSRGGAGGTGSGGSINYTGGRGSYGNANSSNDRGSSGGGGAGSTGNGGYAYIGYLSTPADLPANSANPTGPCGTSCTNGNNARVGGAGGSCPSSARVSMGGNGQSRSSNGGSTGNAAEAGVGGGGAGGTTHSYNNGSTEQAAAGGAGANGMVVIKFTAPLAITLSNFNVSCENGRTISWSTESERNASHFIVERSRDGSDWFAIGHIEATGTTTQTQHYSLQDKSASYGISYYRLKEVDYDGKIRVYDVVASDCSSNNGVIVYPNPTQGNFTLEISSETAFEGTAVVYDLNGKTLVQHEFNATKGISLVYFDDNNLAKGTYIVKIEGESKGKFQPVKLVVN